MILKGINVKEDKIQKLKQEIKGLNSQPVLTIIKVGDLAASKVYVKNKIKFCEEIGIKTELLQLEDTITQEELLDIISKENNKELVNAIFVQLPLPKHINEKEVIAAITSEKDIDGFTYDNIGKLFINEEDGLFPCTVEGIIDILDFYEIKINAQNIVIVGRSNIVGKPLALRLINLGATVTVCNSKTKNIKKYIDDADIFISAIGVAKFFTEEFFENSDLSIIDVGINRDENNKLCGDIDFINVEPLVKNITPVPGGVGIMTVVKVAENVIKAYKNQNKV